MLVRSAWSMWTCALLFTSVFAVGMMIGLVAMGWFDEDVLATVPFGVTPVELSSTRVGIAMALFAASHAVPRLLPRRRIAPRVATNLGDDGSYRSAPSATTVTLNAAQLDGAEIARRDVGLAWSLVFSLAIWGVGFFATGRGSHLPRQHPLEWWLFFAGSVAAIASHEPLRLARLLAIYRSRIPASASRVAIARIAPAAPSRTHGCAAESRSVASGPSARLSPTRFSSCTTNR